LLFAGQLLLGDLHQTAGNMATDCTRIAGSHVAVVTVLRDGDSKRTDFALAA